jgi:hypothetical protein
MKSVPVGREIDSDDNPEMDESDDTQRADKREKAG